MEQTPEQRADEILARAMNGTRRSRARPNIRRDQGAGLLDDVYSFVGRFISYPSDHARIAHTLWVAHAHLMSAWESTPRIAFLSAEPASGKTRCLEITELLVPDPVATMNCTPAYLIRKCGNEDLPPTILFDEIDTVFGAKAKEHEDIRAILNSGHRRGATAGRCFVRGATVETEEISSYAAVAVAGLGWLPDTILTRSIIIRMRRRRSDEIVEPYRRRLHAAEGEAICRRLAGWAAAVLDEATEARPELPAGIEDRNADVWEAPIAVADIAGGTWPAKARLAAVELIEVSRDIEPSLNLRLLADLREVFGADAAMFTKTIIAELCALDAAPWSDLRGKPINDNQLARRLRQYEVKPRNVRLNGVQQKGYYAEDLYDAWQRYLPPAGLSPAKPVPPVTDGLFDPPATEKNANTINRKGDAVHAGTNSGTAATSGTGFQGDGADAGAGGLKPVCEHCGSPERDRDPVQRCAIDGEEMLLHRQCAIELMGDAS